MGKVFGIIALILAIVSLFVPIMVGLVLAIVAMILGIVGIKVDDSPGLGIAGLVIGSIVLIILIMFFILIAPFVAMGAVSPY